MLEVTHRLGHWGPYSGPPVWSQTASSGCFSSSLTNPQGFYASSKVTSSKQAEWPQMAPLGLEGYLSHWRKRCCHYQLKRPPTDVRPPPPPTHLHVYGCLHFPQGLRSRQASHMRWMNSRSVLPAVCSLPPKESSRDSDRKAWNSPRSLLPAPGECEGAWEQQKMESEREIINLQVSSLWEREERSWGAEAEWREERINIFSHLIFSLSLFSFLLISLLQMLRRLYLFIFSFSPLPSLLLHLFWNTWEIDCLNPSWSLLPLINQRAN